MGAFKIIGRHPYTKRQVKKRVYTTEKDFNTYKDDLINRYVTYLNVEVYKLINNEWELFKTVNYVGGYHFYKKYENK